MNTHPSPSVRTVPGRRPTCWVVTDGKAGMENQCLGLAEALGLEPQIKRVALRSPWRELTPYLRLGLRWAAGPKGDPLGPPWPDLLIASGRQSTAAALAARHGSRGRTFTVQIQDPAISPRHFDLVVAPRHDRLRGRNVVETLGALHRVTPARLAAAAAHFAPELDPLPRPRVAVLVGGDNGVYRLTPVIMGDVALKLAHLAETTGCGLMVTPSRRTGADNEAILRARLKDLPAIVWDGTGENPYFAYLGAADAIIATCDSVSMLSEAASTGKPLYVIGLDGGSAKFEAFHTMLRDAGIARPFTGTLEHWTYPPLEDTARVAAEVRRRMRKRGLWAGPD